MKITCPYCNNLFNDTLEKCPSCGAPNSGVVRKSGSQPITIEELKLWYSAMGLPPYSVTRFFIGENCKKPRAFGIYQDEQSKEFIVYKNKDSGERAVRYRGTDEAYAVNELYQRLKQEILQQKRANQQKKSGTVGKPTQKKSGCMWGLIITVALPVVFVLIGVIAILFQDIPKDGYYLYDQTLYYHYDHVQPDEHSDWFWYDGEEGWLGPARTDAVPDLMKKNKEAKYFYLSENLPSSYAGFDFLNTVLYRDIVSGYKSNTGYYQYEDRTYYHLYNDIYSGWYYYDTVGEDWFASGYDDIPYPLQHSETSEDFFYTPTWDSSTQITDFEDTGIYKEYLEELENTEWEDDDDNDYSWDSGDSWDSNDTDWDSDW